VITRESGRNSKVGGTRYTEKIAIAAGTAHRPVSRASAYAAGTLSTSVIATVTTPMITLFTMNVPYGVFENRSVMLLSVGGLVKSNGFLPLV
jgi:hypothetical protein